MRSDERFARYFHLLDDAVTALSVEGFAIPPFVSEVKAARSSYGQHQESLLRQIFLEIKEDLAASLSALPARALVFRTGKTVKNNNIRFFCRDASLACITPGKYAVLLTAMTSPDKFLFIADYDGDQTFQVSYKLNPVIRSLYEEGGLGEAYGAVVLANLTPGLRQFTASQQAESALLNGIALGNTNQWHRPGDLARLPHDPDGKLNDSQKAVLAGFADLDIGVQLLMGPPGTGKTSVIVRLLAELMRRKGDGRPIVVCGPSNQSVQVIASKFHHEHPGISVALYANESRLDPRMSSQLADVIAQQRGDELVQADIIFMTLSATGSRWVASVINKRGGASAVIVDEAGQSSEPETIIVFGLNPQKVLLVGDVHQLPPTVKFPGADQFHYDESMMGRLIKRCEQDYFMLDTQYRMHPDISAFSNHAFYNGEIKDGVNAQDRTRSDLVPYQVIDVEGAEKIDVVTRSYQNLKEALVAVTLVKDALSKGYRLDEISIITPYKAQVALIRLILKQQSIDPDRLSINTVDSFQGSESPVVLVSMVRANQHTRIGFLRRYERLNVAITRPREVLRILVNGNTFNPLQPRSEFEASFLDIMQALQSMPLPQNERSEDTLDYLGKDHGNDFSRLGYRSSFQDYDEIGWQDDWDEWRSCPASFVGGAEGVGELGSMYFVGPSAIARLIDMLEHFRSEYSPKLGKMPILFSPHIPYGTHIVQEIIDRIKVWRGLSFAGLPEPIFRPFQYKFYTKRIEKEGFVDYGYPFDADDNYYPGGYVFYEDVPEEYDEIHQKDLVFDGHSFIKCDLRGVNFYNSRFVKTCFDGSDVRGCQINLDQMDPESKASFLLARQRSALLGDDPSSDLLPTDRLLVDAQKRGVYASAKSFTLFSPEDAAGPGVPVHASL